MGDAGRDRRRRFLLFAILAGLTAIYGLGIVVIPKGSMFGHAWSDFGWLGMTCWAAVESWRARRVGSQKLAYATLTLANLTWAAAMVIWIVYELFGGIVTPFPTLADAGFLLYAPLYALSLFFLSGAGRSLSLSLRHVGDLGMAVATMTFCAVVIYTKPSIESGLVMAERVVALGYPVSYLSALLFALLVLVAHPAGATKRLIAIHVVAITLQTVAYTAYGVEILTRSYQSGHVLDPIWFGGLALTVWGAREEVWRATSAAPVAKTDTRKAIVEPNALDAILPAAAFLVAAVVVVVYADRVAIAPISVIVTTAATFAIAIAVRGLAVLRLERELRGEMQRRERELVRAQKMEAVATLAGGLAHDFNNLLSGILGTVGILRRRKAPEKRQLELIELVEQSAVRACELTKRMLTLSRKREHHRAVVDMTRVLHRVTSLLRGTVPGSVRVTAGDPPEGSRVYADEGELEQALLNLGINGAYAMREGGTLHLSIDREQRQDLGAVAVIRVRDEGCGIPEAIRGRIFEPFFTTRVAGEGSGLGLAMVYAMVQDHGGTIRFDSEVGKGTTFEIVLPETDRELVAPTSDVDLLVSPPGTETVLVVDDRDTPLLAAKVILETCGYAVLVATRPAEALRLFSEHRNVAVLVTDAVMPDMRGHELLSALREAGFNGPAILVTGYEDERLPSAETVFATTIVKPFTASTLSQAVRRALDESVRLSSAG
jgi:signal transduction histidine kinase